MACDRHQKDHPGGWASWEAYRAGWADAECCVCHQKGIQGHEDFESIWIGTGLMYAHHSCKIFGDLFEDMRPPKTWIEAYAAVHHHYWTRKST